MPQPTFTARGSASLLLPSAADVAAGASPLVGLRRVFGGLPFASLGSALLGSPAAPPPPVKEKRARTKRIAGIKNLDVYALALFVDQSAVHHSLHGKFRGSDEASLAKSQKLFDELLNNDSVEKVLRIVITSGLVKRKTFLEALEERLEPPLKQAGELSALEQFKHQFDATSFHKGLVITFNAAGKKLTTTIDGKQVGTITNRQLTHSLLDIYLGTNPVSKGAKDSFGEGLAHMVLA